MPDWLLEAVSSSVPTPPEGALSIAQLAKMLGKSRAQTNAIMLALCETGKVSRVRFNGRYLYTGKVSKK